ncbi:hypothetical protein G7077_02815 [Sphingomonas piscis]|uniref:DUF2157 domain-containing protein n=1 Tax=Sphingomonas piscis TaxID=2714943 RepID=A0A6G7YMN7_9SPHN|nr:hypothetical protein [Sphingomonas piscis]QIK78002.1 hypothetical protein G7077_02815 [Sphingomonas piscis]
MNEQMDSTREDLAFLRALVSEGGQARGAVGSALLAGGLCYGLQCLAQWVLLIDGAATPLLDLAAGVLPTIIFLVVITVIIRRDRHSSGHGVGTRAINAAFGGAGVAALVTSAIFGYLAVRQQSITIWLFHPMMVCVVQGTVWYIAYAIRRQAWTGIVSVGWFASALVLTALLDTHWFVLFLSAALLGLMALPGWVMMRAAPARA